MGLPTLLLNFNHCSRCILIYEALYAEKLCLCLIHDGYLILLQRVCELLIFTAENLVAGTLSAFTLSSFSL